MASNPYIVSLPAPEASPARSIINGVANFAVNAESTADAIALVKSMYSNDVDALWDLATATAVAAAANMSGWKFHLKIVGAYANGASATPIFDGTVTADGSTTGFIAASKTLVSSADYANAETVTLNGKVYTFVTAIGVTEGNVLRGVSEANTMANLVSAITHVGGTPGVSYVTAAVHPTMTASTDGVHTVTLTALAPGSAGNALTLAETAVNAAFAGGATTLSGGVGGLDLLSGLAQKMVVALNASTAVSGISHAALNDGTHVLTISSIADNVGDKRVFASFYGPNADANAQITIPGFVSAKVDAGIAGAALTLTLAADTYTVPTIVSKLGPQVV